MVLVSRPLIDPHLIDRPLIDLRLTSSQVSTNPSTCRSAAIMSAGETSHRKYTPWDDTTWGWNRVFEHKHLPAEGRGPGRPPDLRVFDHLPYVAVQLTLSENELPPQSCHLPDYLVVHVMRILERKMMPRARAHVLWPAIFDMSGVVYLAFCL
ncbi:hypothetical protein BDV95DRAFT_612812 [Massariosphaeria phaeospora]|uniref:Uncharacterized protein n=1 Tax=Massariosphaeria phaeospora TaxID=100035 RepID=A0A7C8M0N1_9PLEO|nr:hypothetical protein BDV95DRAFT_612812 [Massariosphaeria phaeospora]